MSTAAHDGAPRPAGPPTINTIAQLLRPSTARGTSDVPIADREHAVTVVADLLHQECRQWTWAEHHPNTHRPEARRIVGALCREGWAPKRDASESATGSTSGAA